MREREESLEESHVDSGIDGDEKGSEKSRVDSGVDDDEEGSEENHKGLRNERVNKL